MSKAPATLVCRAMSPEEFAKFRADTARQMEDLVAGMEFPRALFAVAAVIALLSAELPPPTVQAFMERARITALAATPEQLAAGR